MNDPSFNLPVITPVVGGELCVIVAIILIISVRAGAIAQFIEGWLS